MDFLKTSQNNIVSGFCSLRREDWGKVGNFLVHDPFPATLVQNTAVMIHRLKEVSCCAGIDHPQSGREDPGKPEDMHNSWAA